MVVALVAGCGGGTVTPAPTTAAPATPEPDYLVAAFGDSLAGAPGPACAGCTPWVDRYADALADETGKTVAVRNQGRPSLRVEQLLNDLTSSSALAETAASADAILVAVGTSDAPWNITDDACDGPATAGELVPWDRYDDACIATEVERFRPAFDGVFQRLVELRGGEPTIFRALNCYNDWIGFEGGEVPPEAVEISIDYNVAWNAMICETAEANGFACADISTAFNGQDGRSASGDLLADDYIHPSDKGYELMAEVLIELGFKPLVP
jgi:lysophospholipase L1-like esterase